MHKSGQVRQGGIGQIPNRKFGITGSVLLITFSHSQHHSGVDVQMTTQFSAYFQRELAETGVGLVSM